MTTITIGYEGEPPQLVMEVPLRDDQTMLANAPLVEMICSMVASSEEDE